MQRDDLIYDMYKRRIDSGLTYGQGVYGDGVSGGSYCTGDALQYNPMYPIGMHMTDRRFNEPFVGGARNEFHEFGDKYRAKNPNKKIGQAEMAKLYRAQLNKPKKQLNKGLKAYTEFMKQNRILHPNYSENDLKCLWYSSTNKHINNPVIRKYCIKDKLAAQTQQPVAPQQPVVPQQLSKNEKVKYLKDKIKNLKITLDECKGEKSRLQRKVLGKPRHSDNIIEFTNFMNNAKEDDPNLSKEQILCMWFKYKGITPKNKMRDICSFNVAPVQENSYEKFRLYALASIHPTPTEEEIREMYEYGLEGNKR